MLQTETARSMLLVKDQPFSLISKKAKRGTMFNSVCYPALLAINSPIPLGDISEQAPVL